MYNLDCSGIVEIDDTKFVLTLEMIVFFATGLPQAPPAGFNPKPVLIFHENDNLPHADTCAHQLSLPLKLTYEKFKYQLNYAVLNTEGFGQV